MDTQKLTVLCATTIQRFKPKRISATAKHAGWFKRSFGLARLYMSGRTQLVLMQPQNKDLCGKLLCSPTGAIHSANQQLYIHKNACFIYIYIWTISGCFVHVLVIHKFGNIGAYIGNIQLIRPRGLLRKIMHDWKHSPVCSIICTDQLKQTNPKHKYGKYYTDNTHKITELAECSDSMANFH